MKFKPLAVGLATRIPGLAGIVRRKNHTGGTDSARYCYSVWLRHLVMANRNHLCMGVPRRVAELGPGDSIGTGLAALLCGAESYTGFDLVPFSNLTRNLSVFDGLVKLIRDREAIPGPEEFPEVLPQIDSYEFPNDILTETVVCRALEEERIARIRRSIEEPAAPRSLIHYAAPWDQAGVVQTASVDMIFSQAVLEHVDALADTYKAMHAWLAPGGFVSHQIDFRCHGLTEQWNGHWTESDFAWSLLRGAAPFLINRQPHSEHLKLLRAAQFQIGCDDVVTLPSQLAAKQLARRFAHLSSEDLTISSAFIQARCVHSN
jgi:hypothetical protein